MSVAAAVGWIGVSQRFPLPILILPQKAIETSRWNQTANGIIGVQHEYGATERQRMTDNNGVAEA